MSTKTYKGTWKFLDDYGNVTILNDKTDKTLSITDKPADAAVVGEKFGEVNKSLESCFQSVSNGKVLVASAITDKRVPTGATATFAEMAANIQKIVLGSGNAVAADVLAGKTFTNNDGIQYTGSMPNHGAKSTSLNCGESFTIPAGYHNGGGKVTANSLASQTVGTATAAQILSGQTAYVDGVKITGTMGDNGAKTATLAAGESYTIPAGYHNGSGVITAAAATAPSILYADFDYHKHATYDDVGYTVTLTYTATAAGTISILVWALADCSNSNKNCPVSVTINWNSTELSPSIWQKTDSDTQKHYRYLTSYAVSSGDTITATFIYSSPGSHGYDGYAGWYSARSIMTICGA